MAAEYELLTLDSNVLPRNPGDSRIFPFPRRAPPTNHTRMRTRGKIRETIQKP